MVQETYHAKVSNFVENLGLNKVRFGSIRVSGPLSDEPISDVVEYRFRLISSIFESRASFAYFRVSGGHGSPFFNI